MSFCRADHFADRPFVIPGFLAAGAAALEQAVISLGIKQALFVKARLLEAVVHIGGNDEIVSGFAPGASRVSYTGFGAA